MNYYLAIDKHGKEWLFKTRKRIGTKERATIYLRDKEVIHYYNRIEELKQMSLFNYYKEKVKLLFKWKNAAAAALRWNKARKKSVKRLPRSFESGQKFVKNLTMWIFAWFLLVLDKKRFPATRRGEIVKKITIFQIRSDQVCLCSLHKKTDPFLCKNFLKKFLKRVDFFLICAIL